MTSKTSAAYQILKEHGKPLKAREIIAIAIEKNMVVVHGLTPAATMNADLLNENKRRAKTGKPVRFSRVDNLTWGLAEWDK